MRLYVSLAVAILGLGVSCAVAAGQTSATGAATPGASASGALVKTTTVSPTPTHTKTPVVKSAAKSKAVVSEAGNTGTAVHATLAHRSPAVATALAVFPGILFHGAGHIYAGSYMKGVGLFLLEGASAYLVYDGIHEYQRGTFNNIKNNKNGIPSGLGYEYGQAGVAAVAFSVWLFTWIDDMSGAHIAAHQFNDVQEQESTISLHLQPRPDGVVLALSSNF